MKNVLLKVVCFVAALIFGSVNVHAVGYKDSLAKISVSAESLDKGTLVDFVKAMTAKFGKDISLVVEIRGEKIKNSELLLNGEHIGIIPTVAAR